MHHISSQSSALARSFPHTLRRTFSAGRAPNPTYARQPWKPPIEPTEKDLEEMEEMARRAREREENFEAVRVSTADDFNLDFDLEREIMQQAGNVEDKILGLLSSPDEKNLKALEKDRIFQRLVRAKQRQSANQRRHELSVQRAEMEKESASTSTPASDTEKPSEPRKERSYSVIADPEELAPVGQLSDAMRDMYARAYKAVYPDAEMGIDDMIRGGRDILMRKIRIARGVEKADDDVTVRVDKSRGRRRVISIPKVDPATRAENERLEAEAKARHEEEVRRRLQQPEGSSFPGLSTAELESLKYQRIRVPVDDRVRPQDLARGYDTSPPRKEILNERMRPHALPMAEDRVDPMAWVEDSVGQIGLGDMKLAKTERHLFERSDEFKEQRKKDRLRARMRDEALAAQLNGYEGDVRELLHPEDRGVEGKEGVYYSKVAPKDRPETGLHESEARGDDFYESIIFGRMARQNQGQEIEDQIDEFEEFNKWQDAQDGKKEEEEEKKPEENKFESFTPPPEKRLEGAIPQTVAHKMPMDYINRFMMRVHPDMMPGDAAMVIDDRAQFSVFETPEERTGDAWKDSHTTVGVRVTSQRAQTPEYETGHFEHPDNIRYYRLSMQFVREHNTTSLSRLNTVLDYYKSLTAMTEVEAADPYRQQNDVPKRCVFTFFSRSRKGAPYPQPDPERIRTIEAPWTDKYAESAEEVAPTAGYDETSVHAPADDLPDEGLEPEDEPEADRKTGNDRLKFVTIDSHVLQDLPHLRMVRVKFRPPKDPAAKTAHFDSRKTVSEMQVAVERLLVELLASVDDEVSLQDMERWRRGLKQHRDHSAWKNRTAPLNKVEQMFKKNNADTLHGIDEKDQFMNSAMAFAHMYPQSSGQHEKAYKTKNHPKRHLVQAMMRGGCINFHAALPAAARAEALQQLRAMVSHGYDTFHCRKWWSRRMTELELLERKGNAKYLGSQAAELNPDNVMMDMGHDDEKETLWPDVERGYGFKLHCAVRFLPEDCFGEPRIVSSNYKLKEAYESSANRDAEFMSMLMQGGFTDVTPGAAELGDDNQHIRGDSVVVPTALSDLCLELQIPCNVRVEELDDYLQEAYLVMGEWDMLMRRHTQEKVMLKDLGVIDREDDLGDGLGHDTGAWLREVLRSKTRSVDPAVMPHTHKLIDFYQRQMMGAMVEDKILASPSAASMLPASAKFSYSARSAAAARNQPSYSVEKLFRSLSDEAMAESLSRLYDPLADNRDDVKAALHALANAPDDMLDAAAADADAKAASAEDAAPPAQPTPEAGLLDGSDAEASMMLGGRFIDEDDDEAPVPMPALERLELEVDDVAAPADPEAVAEAGAEEEDMGDAWGAFLDDGVEYEDDLEQREAEPEASEAVPTNTALLQTLTGTPPPAQPLAPPPEAVPEAQVPRSKLEMRLEKQIQDLNDDLKSTQRLIVELNARGKLQDHIEVVRTYKRLQDSLQASTHELEAVRRIRKQLREEEQKKPKLSAGPAPRATKRVTLFDRQREVVRGQVDAPKALPPLHVPSRPSDEFEDYDEPLHPNYIELIRRAVRPNKYLNIQLGLQPTMDDYGKGVGKIIMKRYKKAFNEKHKEELAVAKVIRKHSKNPKNVDPYKLMATMDAQQHPAGSPYSMFESMKPGEQ